MALTMKPSMTPNIRSVPALLNFLDAARMTKADAEAPMNAAKVIDRPLKMKLPLPIHMVAMAAPNDAPELTPIM